MTTLKNARLRNEKFYKDQLIEELKTKLANLEIQIEKLQTDNLFLEALKQCGVDNWSGYSDAWQLFDEWQNEKEDS